MKNPTRVSILIPILLLLIAVNSARAGAFRVAGGLLFNNSEPGGGIAVDIGDRELALSPFADFYTKSGSRVFGGGINLVVKRPAGALSRVYVSGGGGAASVKIEESTSGITGSASKTQAMIDLVVGVEFDLGERTIGFVQGRWIGTFGGGRVDLVGNVGGATITVPDAIDLELRTFAVQVGIAFEFWE